jgi:predicted O-methyltransferase YrrM
VKDAADAIVHREQATYLEGLEPPRDALLAKMEAFAAQRRAPISDPEVAAFLEITASAIRPRLVVELGTNIGYGAIVLARAAGPGARVVTLELSSELCAIARGYVAEAGLTSRIEVREGAALAELATFEAGSIDLAYIDCVKEEYVAYLDALVPRLAPRGVIVADNVLWRGLVAKSEVPPAERVRTEALRAFNAALVRHPELRATVLPLGDGVAYAVKSTV